jgi:hypothetical protein
MLVLVAVMWRLRGVVQAAKGGAGELVEVLWVGSAVCAIICEVLGAVLTQGKR